MLFLHVKVIKDKEKLKNCFRDCRRLGKNNKMWCEITDRILEHSTEDFSGETGEIQIRPLISEQYCTNVNFQVLTIALWL